jgi:hypothetical protein
MHGFGRLQRAQGPLDTPPSTPGALNTFSIACSISDLRHPVCRRSSVIPTRQAAQTTPPWYRPRNIRPTVRRTKSSVV